MSSSQFLPQELMIEILSWVPVKDLMRFRCVSKCLNSLVFDPTLHKLHLQRSPKNTHTLLTFKDEVNGETRHYAAPCSIDALLKSPSSTIGTCQILNNNFTVSVLGVCNGLVCLLHSSHVGYGEFVEYWVQFWNPATRLTSQDSPRLVLSRYEGSPKFGFGFDDSSETYKVVTIFYDKKSLTKRVGVHCLGDTCWTNSSCFLCFCFPRVDIEEDLGMSVDHGVSVSGTVNWLALPFSPCYSTGIVTAKDFMIFSYDLKNKNYTSLSMPDGLLEVPRYSTPLLKVLKGCLCLSHGHSKTHSDFWLMREFGVQKSWTHLLNISYEQPNMGPHFSPFVHPMILCMSQNKDAVLLADRKHGKFILYNMRDNRIDRYQDFDQEKFEFLSPASYDYVPSLVMP